MFKKLILSVNCFYANLTTQNQLKIISNNSQHLVKYVTYANIMLNNERM